MECGGGTIVVFCSVFTCVPVVDSHRGYREKWLHKSLQKNKDGICKTLDSNRVSKPSFVDHLLQETVKEAQGGGGLTRTAEEDEETEEGSQDEQMESDEPKPVPSEATAEETEKELAEEATEKKGDPPPSSIDWDPFFAREAVEIGRQILEYLDGMEIRLYDAHLQIKVRHLQFLVLDGPACLLSLSFLLVRVRSVESRHRFQSSWSSVRRAIPSWCPWWLRNFSSLKTWWRDGI